jgi:hypothetical protein
MTRSLLQGSLLAGQGDTWDNKKEFWKKNHLLALLQTTCDGLQSAANRSSQV